MKRPSDLPRIVESRSLSLGAQSEDHPTDRTLSITNHDERMVTLELKMSYETRAWISTEEWQFR